MNKDWDPKPFYVAVVYQAILDKNYKFLKSPGGKAYLNILGLDPEAVLEALTNPKPKDTSYPEYFSNINPQFYKTCKECKKTKYIFNFKKNDKKKKEAFFITYNYANLCLKCSNKKYNTSKDSNAA